VKLKIQQDLKNYSIKKLKEKSGERTKFEILRLIYQRTFCTFSSVTSNLILSIGILAGNFIPTVSLSNSNLKGSLQLNFRSARILSNTRGI
jgi:hypothetical protein